VLDVVGTYPGLDRQIREVVEVDPEAIRDFERGAVDGNSPDDASTCFVSAHRLTTLGARPATPA
jgi:hypothetical protein